MHSHANHFFSLMHESTWLIFVILVYCFIALVLTCLHKYDEMNMSRIMTMDGSRASTYCVISLRVYSMPKLYAIRELIEKEGNDDEEEDEREMIPLQRAPPRVSKWARRRSKLNVNRRIHAQIARMALMMTSTCRRMVMNNHLAPPGKLLKE